MEKKLFTEASIAFMQDANQFKCIYNWCKVAVEIYSDYIEVEFRVSDTIRSIPLNHADKWRLFASGDDLVFVFTYYYHG